MKEKSFTVLDLGKKNEKLGEKAILAQVYLKAEVMSFCYIVLMIFVLPNNGFGLYN